MFVLFFLFWVMLNGRITVEITLFGLVISAAMYVFVCKFTEFSFRKDMWIVRKLPWIIGYCFILINEIIKANLTMIHYLLSPQILPEPALVRFHTDLKTRTAQVTSGKFDYPDTRHDHCRDEGWRIPDSSL